MGRVGDRVHETNQRVQLVSHGAALVGPSRTRADEILDPVKATRGCVVGSSRVEVSEAAVSFGYLGIPNQEMKTKTVDASDCDEASIGAIGLRRAVASRVHAHLMSVAA
ncbi:hypothetical protein VTN00DRAFT_6716 [Thermoascus crustaceus]|uniref:uncharacterized protein n=1 Tax=Thermoascus crustaceus TaxID=5088 RepID=UPI003742036A